MGDAAEPQGRGTGRLSRLFFVCACFIRGCRPRLCGVEDGVLFPTGGTVTDLDGDGQLDLLLAHGENAQQPISVFKVTQVCSCVCLSVCVSFVKITSMSKVPHR